MDMINRLPGFSFDGGDGSRGFSGNSGNVLIDGKRPTSKNEYLGNILGRIVAADVERIDVIHGSAPSIDMQGKAVVANIVLKTTESTSIVAIAGLNTFDTGRAIPGIGAVQPAPRAIAAMISRSGATPISTTRWARPTSPASDASRQRGTAPRKTSGSGGNTAFNGVIKSPLAGGDFSANAAANQSEFSSGTFYDDPVTPQTFSSYSRNQNGELGASYQHGFGATTLGVELLQRIGHSASPVRCWMTAAPATSVFLAAGYRREHRPCHPALSSDRQSDPGGRRRGGLQLSARPFALYPEWRHGGRAFLGGGCQRNAEEVFAQASWQLGQNDLTLDAAVRAEYSTISEQGDVSKSRSFFYPKPRFQVTWTLNSSSVVRLRLEHKLDQLNFGDFISSVNLTQNTVTAGNPDLKPDESWQYEAVYEYHFWDKGALTIGALHQEMSNILDDMPVADPTGTLYDVRGNIGDGRADQLTIDAIVPTDRLGILKGGRVNINLGLA